MAKKFGYTSQFSTSKLGYGKTFEPKESDNIKNGKIKIKADEFIRDYGKYFGVSQTRLVSMLQVELKKMGRHFAYVEKGGLIVAPLEELDRNPYMVAHMDVVHGWNVGHCNYEMVSYDNNTKVWSPQGLGADDRFGIVAALEILKSIPEAGAFFTFDEEIGAVGAGNIATFLETTKYLENKVSFLVQVDRRGTSDAVFYDMDLDCTREDDNTLYFLDFIEKTMADGGHAVTEAMGSFSDICNLAPATGACAVNLSASYFSEHTLHETGDVVSLFSTIEAIKHLFKSEGAFASWPYKEKAYAYSTGSYGNFGTYNQYTGGYDYGYNNNMSEIDLCEYCYSPLEEDAVPAKDGAMLCKACKADWE